MPKKTQPYVLFCLEKKECDPSLKNKSIPQLIELCSAEWQSMSLEDRSGYFETAKKVNRGATHFQGPQVSYRHLVVLHYLTLF